MDIICIGAALVDMIATIERFPLEDDEVFVSDLEMMSGGAAANTAAACGKLGLKCAFIGKLGNNDVFGRKIIDDFKKANVNTNHIKYSEFNATGSAYVALNQHDKDRRIFAHSGAADYLSESDIKEEELRLSRLIYLSSLKNISPFVKAAKIGKKYRIPVILNPGMLIIDQGFDRIKNLLRNLDILILSKREYLTLLKVSPEEISERIFVQKSKVLFHFGITILIITMGNKGALLLHHNKAYNIPSIEVENIADTTGAGDAFSAGFIYEYLQVKDNRPSKLQKCVAVGNFVAGKCIQRLGARNGIPSQQEIELFKEELNNKI